MRLPVGLDCIFLRALVAFPFLLPMFPTVVLLDPCQIAKSSCRVVVHTRRLGADVDALANLGGGPLPQLPWKIMTPPM